MVFDHFFQIFCFFFRYGIRPFFSNFLFLFSVFLFHPTAPPCCHIFDFAVSYSATICIWGIASLRMINLGFGRLSYMILENSVESN